MSKNLVIAVAPDGALLLRFRRWVPDLEWLRSLPGVQWDPGERHWRVPRSTAAIAALRSRHPEVHLPPPLHESTHRDGPAFEPTRGQPSPPSPAPDDYPDHWIEALEAAERIMILRAFSPRTRKVYRNHLKGFARWYRRAPEDTTAVDVRAYLVDLADRRRLSRSYHAQALSALRMLFVHVLRRPLVVEAIPQPRRERKLPVVLSRDEIRRVIAAAGSPHQRALITMLYSTGLRVSEVVRVRIGDLDGDRGMLRVRAGKGRKDRYTLLSDRCLAAVNDHIRYRANHDIWLFPGGREGRHVTTRSVQKTVTRIGRRAGLAKRLTPHVLRHTFATHLMESGTDIRLIQELLGHSSTRTTEIYTHVSNRHLARIRNPLDEL